MRFVKTFNINFTDNLPTLPIMKSLWSYLKLLLICLLELGFGFDQSLLRGKPVGKSPYYRLFDRSANWRVKDSMRMLRGVVIPMVTGDHLELPMTSDGYTDFHYIDVIMTTMASQITSLMVVYSIVYSGTDQRKHQSSASLAFVRGIHRDRWIPRTKGQ